VTDATTEFLIALFLLTALAVLVGELFTRLGQVALVGQLLVGVLLGPSVLGPFLGISSAAPSFVGLQTVATFFILLMAGLSLSPEQIWATGISAALLGFAIFFVPFLGGAVVVHLLYPQWGSTKALFVALTISVTALPVLAIMLREFGLLRTKLGSTLLNGSVINEVTAVTVFAVLLNVSQSGATVSTAVATSAVTVALFLTSVLAAHMALRSLRALRLWDRLVRRFRESWRTREAGFALLITMGLGAALYSQFLGLSFVVGAFYAGLLVTPESAGPQEHRSISLVFDAITWGFFIPLFFALVGFSTSFTTLFSTPVAVLLFAALCAFGLSSKLGIGMVVARGLGWSEAESMASGWLLTSRGVVELAMATLLLSDHVFDKTTFTIVAGVGLVTTALAPVGARGYIRRISRDRLREEEGGRRPPVEWSIPPSSSLSDEDRPIL
jgi:Kef-type K+ transport system membrane component KefB